PLAVRPQRADLAGDDIGLSNDVACVCVPSREPERATFTVATDEDRDVVLQRARVTHSLRDAQDATFERGSALPPVQREELERVFEQRVSVGEWREGYAESLALGREPSHAEPTVGPATGDDVERRDDLAEVRDGAVRDPGHQGAQT